MTARCSDRRRGWLHGQAGWRFRVEGGDDALTSRIFDAAALASRGLGVVYAALDPTGEWWVIEGTDLSDLLEGWPKPSTRPQEERWQQGELWPVPQLRMEGV